MNKEGQDQFEKIAREKSRTNIVRELFGFLMHNKKWWLLPILVVLFLFGILIALSGTAAAPFIYTLF